MTWLTKGYLCAENQRLFDAWMMDVERIERRDAEIVRLNAEILRLTRASRELQLQALRPCPRCNAPKDSL